jgi:molybdopterin molybdotransferase
MTEPVRCAPVEVARSRVLASISPLGSIDLALTDALGACLASPVVSPGPMPPFDNAAMDGYAVAATAVVGRLPVAALPIATGQRIPAGSDAVVPLERVSSDNRVAGGVRAGDNVRPRGEEFHAGAELLPAGETLTAAAIGLLAGVGIEQVPVHRRPRVAILVSGDELLPTARRASDELIHDANGPMLRAMIDAAGGEVAALEHVPDDREALRERLLALAASADLLISSGGASVGRPDHLIGLVSELGALDVHQLAVKPGRPTSFGRVGPTPIAVLPGNPFALLAGFELLARPALRRLAGAARPLRPRVVVPVAMPLPADPQRLLLLPVRFLDGAAAPLDASGAAMLSGAARAQGLAFVPPAASIRSGDPMEVELWNS